MAIKYARTLGSLILRKETEYEEVHGLNNIVKNIFFLKLAVMNGDHVGFYIVWKAVALLSNQAIVLDGVYVSKQ